LQTDLSSWHRTIDKNNLIYSTQAQPRGLKVADALGLTGNNAGLTARGLEQAASGKAFDQGLYWILGWQGEKYVAVNGKVDRLSKLVLEHGTSAADARNLTVGETWNIGDGWELKINSTNIITAPKKVQLILSKDGIKKNETVINESMIYTYVERNLSNETDVPVFVTYVNNISTDTVQLMYTWAISESVIQIQSGTAYGVFKDAAIAGKTLALKNSDTTVSLIRDTSIDLMGNLKFKVADSNWLRFYPMIIRDHPGTYELSGTVWYDTSATTAANSWDPINFAGFFYEIKDNLGTENLSILQMNLAGSGNSIGWLEQRTIDKSNLIYSTTAQPKGLQVASALGLMGNNPALTDLGLEGAGPGRAFDGGLYYILGWQGEKQVALNGKVYKLSKLVIEQGTSAADKKTLSIGETWYIGDGWELTANSIDAKATPRQVWVTLTQNGVKKDDRVVSAGTYGAKPIVTYVEKSLGGETDVPVFVTYVDSIFTGATTDMVQLRYTWAISENVTQITSSASYGVFKDATIAGAGKTLALKNTDTAIDLTRESIIDLMGSLKFKVADSDTLRFYPFVTYEIPHPPPPPPPPKPFDTLKFESKQWNLVSVPKTLINPDVNIAFENLSFDQNNVKWHYNVSIWEHPSNILPLRGYWVYDNASTPIFQKLNYKDMAGPYVPPSMTLKSGWNLIGHTSTKYMPVSSALVSIEGKYSHLLTYSPEEGWKMYIVGNPTLQQFNAFEPGKGYWIFMTQDATYAAVEI
jgi:S-layer protein (TIGR01567 family)